jgi:hypothetical protein
VSLTTLPVGGSAHGNTAGGRALQRVRDTLKRSFVSAAAVISTSALERSTFVSRSSEVFLVALLVWINKNDEKLF